MSSYVWKFEMFLDEIIPACKAVVEFLGCYTWYSLKQARRFFLN